MWKAIFTASIVVSLVRAFPALFKSIERLKDYPRINKFLDYTICLVTGEVIYSIAFKGVPADANVIAYSALIVMTILIAAAMMWYTTKLSKSLLVSISFFILGYTTIGAL